MAIFAIQILNSLLYASVLFLIAAGLSLTPVPRIPPSCAREETPQSRGMPCLFLNTERVLGGKPPEKSGFRRHLVGSKMPKEMFFTAISRWRVVSRRALDASGFWQE